MIRYLLIALLWASPAVAEVARVTAGEHGPFTRVVVQFPEAVDWQIGRIADGYELRVPGPAPRYDLTRAFDLIGRQRVASLAADPVAGGLRLRVACTCHALPFALRPDTVVIDLRDGPAPEGWGFENGFDGVPMPPLQGAASGQGAVNYPQPKAADPAPPPWDWRDMALGNRWSGTPVERPAAPAQMPLPDASMEALRTALIDSFARAATQDLVDPLDRPPPIRGGADAESTDAEANAAVRLGSSVEVRGALDPAPDLAADGTQCPGDARLALQDWGDERPISEQMADATASLTGEFDRTQPDALVRSVRFQLFLGFGAEARSLLRAFPDDQPDAGLWLSMSHLVDGETDPGGAFRGLAGCDDPAALWAMLADPSLPPSAANTKALMRSFSALPVHLRATLGPQLAERFMAAGDRTTAQVLSDAILRPLALQDERRTALMQARLALQSGDPVEADARLAPLLDDPGPLAPQIIATQVDLAARTGAPVSPVTVTAIEAMLREADSEVEPMLRRALVLAQALSGSFGAAFVAVADAPDARQDLWHLLAEKGPDGALMTYALAEPTERRPQVAPETRRELAERLLQLGFAEAAQDWVGTDDPLLSARAALLLGQPEAVLRLLAPADGAEARKLKAEALLQLDAGAAVPAFDSLGDAASAARAARLAEAWPELARSGPEPWRKLAGSLAEADGPATQLARGRALAQGAAETRAAIAELLSAVPAPEAQ